MAGTALSGRSKPTALKVIQGTQRADRVKNEPKPGVISTLPPPPSELNDWGKDEWRNTGNEWLRLGLLTVVDLVGFFSYCKEYGNYMDFSYRRQKSKDIDEIKTYHHLALMSQKAMKDMMIQFGFTPASRSRMNTPKQEEKDPFDGI